MAASVGEVARRGFVGRGTTALKWFRHGRRLRTKSMVPNDIRACPSTE